MNITPEQYDRLSRFLDADMDLAEMEVFAQELKANPEMRAQLDFEQSVRDGFAFKKEGGGAVPQQETIATAAINNNEIQNGKRQSSHVKKIAGKTKWLTIAAAATVLAVIASLVYYETTKPKQAPGIVKQKENPAIKKKDTIAYTNPVIKTDTATAPDLAVVFKQYFTKDELPERYPMYLADAFIDYEKGKETKVQQLNLTNIGETRGEDEKQEILQLGHYYKGISFLKTGNAAAAIINLQWVILHSTDTTLNIKAQWYLALAFLKINKIAEAKSLLKKVVGNKNDYSEKAKRMSRELAE